MDFCGRRSVRFPDRTTAAQMDGSGRLTGLALGLWLFGQLFLGVPLWTGIAQAGSRMVPVTEAAECRDLVEQFGPRFFMHPTRHFALIYATDHAWALAMGRVLEETHEEFYRTFREAGFDPKPIEGRLTWVCFVSYGDFDDYARRADRMDMSWSDGYYSARTNRVALVRPGKGSTLREGGVEASLALKASRGNSDLYPVTESEGGEQVAAEDSIAVDESRATHELSHQLAFNSGIQKRGVMYPMWVSEGLATSFEREATGGTGLREDNPVRRRCLIEAYRGGRLMPLEDFLTLTRLPASDPSATREIYAQAWSVFRFLFSDRREELRRYLAALSKLEPGRRDRATIRREIVAAFGPIDRLDVSWKAHLEKLSDQTASEEFSAGVDRR